MPETATWTEDVCTCEHVESRHKDQTGKCATCTDDASWRAPSARCSRYQWNGEPRTRVW